MQRHVVLLLVVAAGCTSTTTYLPLPSDSGTTSPGPGDTTDAPDAEAKATDAGRKKEAAASKVEGCSRKTTGALVRVDTNPSGSLPEAEGGAVADGHYVLVQAIVMASSAGESKVAGDLWIGGGRYEWQRANGDGWHYSYGGNIEISGTRIEMTVDCGGQDSAPSWAYSASGDELTVSFTTINGFEWVYVLKRTD